MACYSERKSGQHHSCSSSAPLTLASEMYASIIIENGSSVALDKHLTICMNFLMISLKDFLCWICDLNEKLLKRSIKTHKPCWKSIPTQLFRAILFHMSSEFNNNKKAIKRSVSPFLQCSPNFWTWDLCAQLGSLVIKAPWNMKSIWERSR